MAVVRQNMETAKRQRGLYDFNDLIARTARLLSTSDQAQWVLYKLDSRLDHVLVDEAQDTSEAQWRIILALVEEFYAGQGQRDTGPMARTAFVVGDRKQSIYSFQGADVDVFDAVRERLTSLSQGALKQIGLAVSFRSLANILSAVDTVFATGARARQGFGTGATEERPHTAARKDHPGIVEFWPLMTREEGDQENYWRAPVNSVSEDHPRRKLAIFVAQTIKGWLGRRQLHGADRPVGPGDILILLQRRSEVFSALIAELHRLGIPVAGADRLKLAKQIIVHDFLALAQVLVLPGDDYSLACLLKSPLVPAPLDEDSLFSLAHGRQDESLWQRLERDHAQADNAAALKTYAAWASELGPFDFFSRVAQRRRTAILERLGSEAEDALRVLLDLALGYERDEGPSLAGFASWLKSTDFELKREMEEAAGQVRIMTVHGAKGLEAPIVILPDAADTGQAVDASGLQRTTGTGRFPGLPVFVPEGAAKAELVAEWKNDRKQRNFEERMRLFYVAMTRARDELYLCGSFNKKEPSKDSWWGLAEEAFAGAAFRDVILADGRKARRLGPDDGVAPGTASKDDPGETPLPGWLVTHTPHGSTARKHLARNSSDIDLAAARRGIAIHGLLEALMDLPADRRVELAHARGKRNGLEASLVDRLLALIGNPQTAFFFQPGSQAEVELGGRADDGAAVLGRIDRLAWHEGALCILDYKSARQPATSLPSDHAYVRQLSTYARLLGQAYPGTPVRAAVLWTQSGELEWLPAAFLANPS
jgi:ATP-dependent helicase/nuclease subunit A